MGCGRQMLCFQVHRVIGWVSRVTYLTFIVSSSPVHEVPFLCQTPLHTKNISENVADNPLVVKLEKECHEWNPGSGHKWDSHRKLRKTSPEAGKWCSRRRHNHQGERSKTIRRRALNGFVFLFFFSVKRIFIRGSQAGGCHDLSCLTKGIVPEARMLALLGEWGWRQRN